MQWIKGCLVVVMGIGFLGMIGVLIAMVRMAFKERFPPGEEKDI